MTLPLPPLLAGRNSRGSQLPFHLRFDTFSVNTVTGAGGVLTRTTSIAVVDSLGTTRTAIHSQPAFEMVDWDADGTRDTPALKMDTSGTLAYTYGAKPQALTVYVEFVQVGAMAGTTSDAVVYVGNAGNTGARFWIDSNGTYYQVRHHNGTTEVTSLLGAAPTDGQRVALRATLDSSGRVQIFQSINGAGETSGSLSGTNSLPTAWSAATLYANSTGSTNQHAKSLVRIRLAHGSYSAAAMQVMY